MSVDVVEYIMDLMSRGMVYEVSTEVGSFIIAEADKVQTITNPVQYAILKDSKLKPDDFPIWAPYVDGRLSPYGKGLPTVNLRRATTSSSKIR